MGASEIRIIFLSYGVVVLDVVGYEYSDVSEEFNLNTVRKMYKFMSSFRRLLGTADYRSGDLFSTSTFLVFCAFALVLAGALCLSRRWKMKTQVELQQQHVRELMGVYDVTESAETTP